MPSKHLNRPLSRLFHSTPSPPPSLAEQVAALDSASAEQLTAVALNDGEAALRAAAIERLPDGESLRKLAGLSDAPVPTPPLAALARQRVARLVDAGAIDVASLAAGSTNPGAVLTVAELCTDPAQLERVLASIHDPQEIAKLVVEGSSSRLRQLAAQRIEDREQLNHLLKRLHGKDKSVYRILKEKRDALRAEAQREAQVDSNIRALCASLEALASHPYDPLYTPAFEHFEARWRSLEGQAQPWVRERVRHAIDRCREVIAGRLREAAEQAALIARQAAAQAALQAEREQAAVQAAEEARQRDEAAALAAAEAEKIRAAEKQARAERLAAEARAIRQVGALLTRAHTALREGQTGPAAGIRRAIESRLPVIPSLPPALARQLQDLDAKLSALKEWKGYAVAPKRAELIARVESLIGSTEHPVALADQIKELRAQWKTISQGIVVDSESDWQRFNQAALSAYEPCRAHFEAQAQLRAENLQRRMRVLERLRAFESAQDSAHPDWRAIGVVLREARQEWRRHAPVDRVAVGAVQEEFDAALGRLRARLAAWHAQNAADKQSLIQRAQALLAVEDGREAVDAAKELQRRWRDVGPAPRELEGPLWNAFREHCDAVYQKRQQAYAEYEVGLQTNKVRAVALCEEVEQAAAQSGPALREAVQKIPHWRSAFESLGEMPRADERGLHARFERALKLCEAKVSQQRLRDAAQSFENLLEAARRICVYGWAVALAAAAAEHDDLKQAAEVYIAGVPKWPKGGATALKEAWAKAESASATGVVANEAALRTLCIRSEIFGDRPTPPEDLDLRRSYQLQRLVQGMGQRDDASVNAWESLAMEWVRVGPVPAAVYDSLLARFLLCRSL